MGTRSFLRRRLVGLRRAGAPDWLVGAVVALVMALLLLLEVEGVVAIERNATDLLFEYGRPAPPAPSDRIVHVDIDDSSLDTIGRWPWPRKLIAESIAALDHFGAKVIAVDMLLPEAQKPEYSSDGAVVDHDLELERAFRAAKAKVVLSVSLDSTRSQLGPLWLGAEGQRYWHALQAILARDITAGADDVIRELGLDSDRAERVRLRLREMKRIAIRQRAAELAAEDRLDLATLRASMLPEGSDRFGSFPELTLMEGEMETLLAARRFERDLPPAPPHHSFPVADNVIAPLPRFAEAVEGAGFVNAEPDSDGKIRSVRLRWVKSGKVYFQLGLAAAAAFRDLPLSAFAATRAEVEAGGRSVVLDDDPMVLSWPRVEAVRRAVHISLGRVLEMAWRERELARLRARERELASELVRVFLAGDGWVPADLADERRAPELLEALHEQVEFMLSAGEPDDPDALRNARTAREWQESTAEVARASRELSSAAHMMRVALEGRIVFVGWNATGNFGDFFPTVLFERTPGVVVHSIVANAFLTGYQVLERRPWNGAAIAFVLGLAVAVLTSSTGIRLSFLLALLLAVGYLALNTLVVFSGMRMALGLFTPLAAIGLSWTGTTAMRAVRERREKAQLRRQFGARISRRLFDYLIENPELVNLEGEEREVTCFFSDLAGFTGISESLDSRTTVSILNRYMWEMNDELTKYHAYVNKFLGDGIMAVWGAFDTGTPHADRACRAALGCFERLEKMLARPEFEKLPRLSMRIGIATGVATVGDCGAPPDLRDYTVIGDSVNLAARLESANKQFGTRLVINGRAKELLPEEILTRPLGQVAVSGQKSATSVHEVLALRGRETEAQRALAALTAEAVAAFAARRLDESRALWERVRAGHGDTPLVGLYLAQIDAARAAPGEPFDGVLRLTSK